MTIAVVHLKSGKLKMLAITTAKRHPDFPDVPTLAELGVKGMDYEQWFGVLAPAGTPEDFKKRLEGDAQKWVKLAADMGIKPLD
jgi:tripartite-type tricarboxylate transporter receptor subunit TctC